MSPVNDSGATQDVVLGRDVTSLRSVELRPHDCELFLSVTIALTQIQRKALHGI